MSRKIEKYWKDKWKDRKQPVNSFARRSFVLIKNLPAGKAGKKFKTLLEVGCGMGQDSLYFASKGFKVTALDFSESGIKKLKVQKDKNVNYILKDLRSASFKNNSFDVIYAHLSLHYFNDLETAKIFKKLYKALKPGGYIFVKCKSIDDSLYGKGEKVGEDMYKKGHTRHFFSKEYMTEKLKVFKIIKIRKTSSVYHAYKSAFIEAMVQK